MSSRVSSIIPFILAVSFVGCGASMGQESHRHVPAGPHTSEELADTTIEKDGRATCRDVWERIDDLEPLPEPGADEGGGCASDAPPLRPADETELRRLIAGVAKAIDSLDFTTLACVSDPMHGLDLEAARVAPEELSHMAQKTVAFCGADCDICEPAHFPAISAYFREWGQLASRVAELDVGCYRNAPSGLDDAPHARLRPPLEGHVDNADTYVLFFERHALGPSGQVRWFLRAAAIDWHKPRCPG